uniref:Replication factor C subunit 1 n=1 Tax=Graphocephala atropunctata TaxID=36148 RepID=A0A1B6MVA5_9HEMI
MSRDIRSFFTMKTTSLSVNTQDAVKKPSQRKRTIVIDSDSDEETSNKPTKRSKSSSTLGNHKESKKNEDTKMKSKYFESEKVDVSDVFGSKPIQRDNSRNIIKKAVTKKDKEFHLDKDFESELMNLDVVGVDILSKDKTDAHIINQIERKDNESAKNTLHQEKAIDISIGFKKSTNAEKRKDETECNYVENKKIKSDKDVFFSGSSNISNKSDNIKLSPLKMSRTNKSSSTLFTEKISPEKSTSNNSSTEISPSNNTITPSTFLKTSPLKKSLSLEKPTDINQNDKMKLKKEDPKSKSIPSPKHAIKSKDAVEKKLKQDEKPVLRTSQKDGNLFSKEKKIVSDINGEVSNLSSALSNLWVEKYKPVTTRQIIGQQGDKSCVNKLTTWLRNWHHNHSGQKKLVRPGPWVKNDDGAYFKAALLSGPPGVGKTTTAHLVSRELGFDVVEFNASDTRSKKLLHQEVSELLSTNSLSPFFTGKGEQVTKKHVLLMDEVDGMAGNEDRGGVQELIQLIKGARVPIICMCNDRNHPKIRSLANYCFDLRFSKPRTEQIKGAMMSLCFKEKLKLTPEVLTEIIASANQDIRLIINHLSMLSIEKSGLANSTKHIKMGPWDVVRKIFSEEEHKSMSIHDKCDLFFHDYSITPLFVQENYLNAVPHKPEAKNKIKKIELFASAARSLSFGDLVEKSIRSHNAWSLLPVQAIFSSLVPGQVLEGHLGAQINFPAWFGKNSRQTKMSRLLQELTVHSRLKISGNKEAMNLDYLVPLERSIVLPLVREGTAGIPQALSSLSEYSLVREDLESLSELSSWPNTKNMFSEVESKVKAAFTRAYNKTSAPTPYAAVPIKKGTKSDFDSLDTVPEEEEDVPGVEEEEEEDGLEVDSMIVVKKKPSTKKVDNDVPSTSKGSKNSKRGRKK